MTNQTNEERLEKVKADRKMAPMEYVDGVLLLDLLDVDWLIQQVERVQELERLLNESKDGLYWNNLSLLHWKAENARLRKTLEEIKFQTTLSETPTNVLDAVDQALKGPST